MSLSLAFIVITCQLGKTWRAILIIHVSIVLPPDALLPSFNRSNVLIASSATIIFWTVVEKSVSDWNALGSQELDDILL